MKIIDNGLFDSTVRGLEKSLDLSWKRNEAISSNIANAETPQYRATDVNFASELDRAFGKNNSNMLKTDGKHLDIESEQGAHLIPDLSGATKPDGNNVDIDLQMGRLAYNSSKYSGAATLLRKKFSMIANALRGI